MKWNLLIVFLGIILFSYGVFAAIEITPSNISVGNLYGGENYITQVHVKNTFGAAVYVILFKDVVNISHDYNGFNLYVSDNNFFLMPSQTKDVNLEIDLDQNIYPEDYNITLWASTDLETVGYPIYISSGGVVYKDKNVYVDRNFFKDRNVSVPIKIKTYLDRNVFIDKNIYIDRNIEIQIGDPNAFYYGLGVAAIIFIAIAGLGYVVIKLKGGKTNGSNRNNEQPNPKEIGKV
jgi:hypothetical protein